MAQAKEQADALGIVDALAQLAFLIQGTLARRAAAHELSLIQTRLLGVLRDRSPSMNQLAAILELDKSSITGLVDRAERRGLVRRTVSTEDRRAYRVSLTARGRSLAARVAKEFDTDIAALVVDVPVATQATLSRLASQIVVANATARGLDLSNSLTTAPVHRARAGRA
jgi:MarR family transcriptional regulator, lower aerobic nicotinate degradation pathway regulator